MKNAFQRMITFLFASPYDSQALPEPREPADAWAETEMHKDSEAPAKKKRAKKLAKKLAPKAAKKPAKKPKKSKK